MSQQNSFDFMGERLRDEGCEKVISNNRDFAAEVYEIARSMAATADEFTVEDLHARCGSIPRHHNAWGAAMQQLQRDGIIHQVRTQKSRRPEAHARVIPVYRGKARR